VDAADTAHQLVTLSPSKKNSSLCDLRHDVRRLITRACFAFFFEKKCMLALLPGPWRSTAAAVEQAKW
jgi:hypothetical protein